MWHDRVFKKSDRQSHRRKPREMSDLSGYVRSSCRPYILSNSSGNYLECGKIGSVPDCLAGVPRQGWQQVAGVAAQRKPAVGMCHGPDPGGQRRVGFHVEGRGRLLPSPSVSWVTQRVPASKELTIHQVGMSRIDSRIVTPQGFNSPAQGRHVVVAHHNCTTVLS